MNRSEKPYGTSGSIRFDVVLVDADGNPFRYRSYYWDEDTWFYYLQSRYYDPAIGRFINADAYTSTGQGILGNNMFAYCYNNPVFYADRSGLAPRPTTDLLINDGASAYVEESDKSESSAEYTVLQSKGISFYNGIPVIRVPFGGDVGFSAGVIFLGNKVKANESGIATLKHEYGHVIHLSQIGWESYILWVLIPSVSNFHRGVKYDDYFSQPWEYIADVLGGVERTSNGQPYVYSSDAQERAKEYWQFTYEYTGVYPNP